MKMILAGLAALAFVAPAAAQDVSQQNWPKQDWRVSRISNLSAQTPSFYEPDGGARPIPSVYSTNVTFRQPAPTGRSNIALDVGSIRREGKVALVSYFVWPDDKSSFTEISSRIECGKTGEQINAVRQYDQDFTLVGGRDMRLRRTDATARAVAIQVCSAARVNVSDKSLPELIKGG